MDLDFQFEKFRSIPFYVIKRFLEIYEKELKCEYVVSERESLILDLKDKHIKHLKKHLPFNLLHIVSEIVYW